MVNIYVGKGENEEHFTVHKEALCNKISYFEAMFKVEFEEARTNTGRCPEDDPKAFDLLFGWVYDGSLRPLFCVKQPLGEDDTNNGANPLWEPEMLYALADKLCIPELMDPIMDVLKQSESSHKVAPPAEIIGRCYGSSSRTPAGSAIRKYLACWCAFLITRIWKKGDSQEEPEGLRELSRVMVENPELNMEVVRILNKYVGRVPYPPHIPDCEFHTHEKNIRCPWEKE